VLLHGERSAALFALLVAVLSVLGEARRGRLPTQLTTAGLAYEPDVTAAVELAVADVQDQLDVLRESLDELTGIVDRNREHEG